MKVGRILFARDENKRLDEALKVETRFSLFSREMAPFMVIFTGQIFSLFGSRLVQFALVWWITESTGKASTLAIASIMALLPQVLLGPFAGTLVDRLNRKWIMIIADSVIASMVGVLVILYATGFVQLWHIYAAMFIRSLGDAFQWPAMQSTTSLMVPKDNLSRIAGLNQSFQGIARILTPPMGAFLIQIFPIESVLIIDIITAVFAVTPLFFINVPHPVDNERQQVITVRTILSDIHEGASFIWGWKGLRVLIAIPMVLNLLMTPAFSLLPLIVTNYYERGAIEFAWLQSAMGIGMIAGGLFLSAWRGFRKKIVTAMVATFLSGFVILLFSTLPQEFFFIAVASIFFFSFLNAVANGNFQAVMQSSIPISVQGRVFTMLNSLSGGMTPIGLALAGPVSDILGIRIWFMLGGLAFLFLGFVSFFSRSIMNLEEEKQELK
jgi:DHA3 family macrolide efflux protein-like MFS transporter